MKDPQTMAAMVIGIASASGVPEGDLIYVAECKIFALYPTLDPYSVHLAVKDAMSYWHAYKSYLGEFEVHQGGLLQ
jgi:hypothetical protein